VIEQLQARGAGFQSLGDPIDRHVHPQGVFTLQILGAVAELERQLIGARTRAGLKAAMALLRPRPPIRSFSSKSCSRTAADELPPYRDQPWIIDKRGYRKQSDPNLTLVPVGRL
jgi:DNA invertase Pin-like site-specific DNA recombinase